MSGGNAYLCPKKAAMNYLEEKIMQDGVILPGNVLKVDSFLNHQVDIDAMRFMAQELQRRFEGVKITKILTIEASGIAIATMLAHYLHVPFVFAKKCLTINSIDDKYVSHAFSFTENRRHSVYVSKPYLSPADHVLVVDDFLAESEATHALIDIVRQAGATLAGIGIAIEKGYQKGGRLLRDEGYHVESIAIIKEMDVKTQTIRFVNQG